MARLHFWLGCCQLFATSTVFAYKVPVQDDILNASQRSKINVLLQFSDALAALYEGTSKTLVFVSVSRTIGGQALGVWDPYHDGIEQSQQKGPQVQDGVGSGFFFDLQAGLILTNVHVIEGAQEISLKLANGKQYDGLVVGKDGDSDLAVVRVKDKKFDRRGLGELGFAGKDDIKVGSLVVALGAPFGLEASLSLGIISASGRGTLSIAKLGDFLQTDAAINPGNSGGPLLNSMGRVVGVNTAIYSRAGGYNGIGFAIPSSLARQIAEQLVNHGSVRRGYLGIYLQEIEGDFSSLLEVPGGERGLVVRHVEKGSPAAAAGMIPGDYIVAIDEQSLGSEADALNKVSLTTPGDTLTLRYYRNGRKFNKAIKVAALPELKKKDGKRAPGRGFVFGMHTQSSRGANGTQLRVVAVDADSPAGRSDVRAGDAIVTVNGLEVASVERLKTILRKGGKALIQVERPEGLFYLPWQAD